MFACLSPVFTMKLHSTGRDGSGGTVKRKCRRGHLFVFPFNLNFFSRGKCHAPQCLLSIERNLLSACVRENSSLENQNVNRWRENLDSVAVFYLIFSDNFSMNMSTGQRRKKYNGDAIISIAVNSLPIWFWNLHTMEVIFSIERRRSRKKTIIKIRYFLFCRRNTMAIVA